jgi:hypothetical protein
LFKNSLFFQVTRKYWVCNVHCRVLLADKTLASTKGLHQWCYLSNYLCRNLKEFSIYIYKYMIFQNCTLLKDSRISPCICSTKDFGSKTIRTGVSLQGATSKRDSTWHSPVFTCISPNRIPVKRINRTAVRNLEMHEDLRSHWANLTLYLIKFVMWIITDIMCADVRKQRCLISGI